MVIATIISVAIGVAAFVFAIVQQFRIHKIYDRNRVHSWKLARNAHKLMGYLEEIKSGIEKKSLRFEEENTILGTTNLAYSWVLAATLVQDLAEFLILEFNVSKHEIEKKASEKEIHGYLEEQLGSALGALEQGRSKQK